VGAEYRRLGLLAASLFQPGAVIKCLAVGTSYTSAHSRAFSNSHNSAQHRDDARPKRHEREQTKGYTIPLLVSETRILDKAIAAVFQEDLLSMNLSTLIPEALKTGA